MPDTSAFAEMRKLLNRKVVEQHREGAIGHEEFTNYNVVVPDHQDHHCVCFCGKPGTPQPHIH
jgi:hypothetical protein